MSCGSNTRPLKMERWSWARSHREFLFILPLMFMLGESEVGPNPYKAWQLASNRSDESLRVGHHRLRRWLREALRSRLNGEEATMPSSNKLLESL